MRVISWNVHSASRDSDAWKLLLELNPDIALLQDVRGIPEEIESTFKILSRRAIYKNGKPQRFSTAVMTNGKITREIQLTSEYEWVNRELEFFKGNFIGCSVEIRDSEPINVISAYCPTWPSDEKRLSGIDISTITTDDMVGATDVLWGALKTIDYGKEKWIVGGDFNSSSSLQGYWGRSSKEFLDRMDGLGFHECLREYSKKMVPTFQNAQGKKLIHQIDHLFVTNNLHSQLKKCGVGDKEIVFGNYLSDHLPIIADFDEK